MKKEKGQVVDRNDSFIGRTRGKSCDTSGSGKDPGRIRNRSVTISIVKRVVSIDVESPSIVRVACEKRARKSLIVQSFF